MILGTGIDIIEVDRVAEKVSKNNGFLEKVFSAAEIEFCAGKKKPAEHYAARFAAKEAFLKATGKGLMLSHHLHQIQVTHDDLGKPHITLIGELKDVAIESGWNKIHLSMS